MLIRTAALVALSAAPALAAPQTYAIDPDHTLVSFRVDRLGFSETTGWFGETSGEIVFDPEAPEASSVRVSIPVGSVDTNLEARDAWVAGDDVLKAAAQPEITFVSTGIEVTGENAARITGDLSMAGATREVVLDTTFNKMGENPISKAQTIGFTATGSLMRSEFGADGFLGPIGDEVAFQVDVEAIAR